MFIFQQSTHVRGTCTLFRPPGKQIQFEEEILYTRIFSILVCCQWIFNKFFQNAIRNAEYYLERLVSTSLHPSD